MFLRRQDGSVDFNRSWSEYAAGFGSPASEFWLGLFYSNSVKRANFFLHFEGTLVLQYNAIHNFNRKMSQQKVHNCILWRGRDCAGGNIN